MVKGLRNVATALAVVAVVATGCSGTNENRVAPQPTPSTAGDAADDGPGGTAQGVPTTVAPGRISLPDLGVRQVARLDRPVALTSRPGSRDVYIAEQGGVVRRLTPRDTGSARSSGASGSGGTGSGGSTGDADGSWRVESQPVLDISPLTEAGGERGLLGVAFAPDGRRLFVNYTDLDGNTVVASYAMTTSSGGTPLADRSTRTEVLTVEQPRANHNGGQLAFGPDGYLYVGLGDGGGFGDPDDEAQNPTTLLGTVVRIDPDGSSGDDDDDRRYAVPADNPFVGSGFGVGEVWLFGVRNPWRFSFDRDTGDLWVADVGESDREEINLLPASDGGGRGANLGWRLFEGTDPHTDEARDADDNLLASLVWPTYEYTHDDGCSVIGGHVYRGEAIDGLSGTYVFGDYCNPAIRALQVDGTTVVAEGDTGLRIDNLSALGEDTSGELWLLSLDGGVFRLVAR